MPVVAGRFYPARAEECRQQAQACLSVDEDAAAQHHDWLGGLVPHAGWICSGAVAGRTIATLARQGHADVVVLFGAIHSPVQVDYGACDSYTKWRLPGGDSDVATDLRRHLVEGHDILAIDDRPHLHEHSIEVQLPLVQQAWPDVPVLPIAVPPDDVAEDIGRRTAQLLAKAGARPIYLASSDLTHYGPDYDFTPDGPGSPDFRWALDNDQRLLDLMLHLDVKKIIPEASNRASACGPGAIAAMLAACREAGASEARLLWHTNSAQTLQRVLPEPATDAVGYASVVVR